MHFLKDAIFMQGKCSPLNIAKQLNSIFKLLFYDQKPKKGEKKERRIIFTNRTGEND